MRFLMSTLYITALVACTDKAADMTAGECLFDTAGPASGAEGYNMGCQEAAQISQGGVCNCALYTPHDPTMLTHECWVVGFESCDESNCERECGFDLDGDYGSWEYDSVR